MKVYLSGSFDARDEIAKDAAFLRGLGFEITSSWLNEPPIRYDSPEHEEWQKRARANEDLLDVERSDVVVVYTHWPSTSGGLHVELGIAAALRKRIIVFGPRLNVFHYLNLVEHEEGD